MKKYLNKLLLLAGVTMLLLSACKKQEIELYYQGGTAPILTANVYNAIPLIPADSLNSAVVFSWTNPNYILSNGISSQNVTYNLEIDTVGANFTSPSMQTYSFTSSLDTSITVKSLNILLTNKLGLTVGQTHNVQVRLISSLSNQVQLVSNSLSFSVLPYTPPPPPPLFAPPSTGTLFIVGDATPGGWPTLSNDPKIEQFTQLSNTEYQITISLTGGKAFKFVATPGKWTEQWSNDGTAPTSDNYTGNLVAGSNPPNGIAPPDSGNYLIDVNFQTGKYTFTKQ